MSRMRLLLLTTETTSNSSFRDSDEVLAQVATKCGAVMFFGPLVPDGYGCCYNPQEQSISFGLSSFKSCAETSALRFRDALEESLTQMHDCLKLSQKSKL
ncbi:carnitine O-acetyltransferase [Ixodes scapularis]